MVMIIDNHMMVSVDFTNVSKVLFIYKEKHFHIALTNVKYKNVSKQLNMFDDYLMVQKPRHHHN